MQKAFIIINYIFVILAVAGCVRFCNSEFMQIDSCLDHGGRWDYEAKVCIDPPPRG